MNPPPARKEPLPRGFWAYVGLLGLTGGGAVASPWIVTKTVSSDVAELRTDVKVLQTQQATTNITLEKIERALAPAVDWQSERDRIETVIRSLVKEEALKR